MVSKQTMPLCIVLESTANFQRQTRLPLRSILKRRQCTRCLNSIASICASGSKDPFVATSTPISSRPELSIWQDGRLLTEADADFPSDCDPHRSSIVSETTGGYNMHARSPRESFLSAQQSVSFVDAVGRISADVVCIYPPGIPLLIPGQVITKAGVGARRSEGGWGYLTGCVTTGVNMEGASPPGEHLVTPCLGNQA